MIPVLAVTFIILILLVGGNRTAKSIVTLCGNALVLTATIVALYIKLPPLLVTAVACVLITMITLFFQNDINVKTVAAFWAVMIVVGLLMGGIYFISVGGSLQGFPVGQYHIRESNGYGSDIGIKMATVQVSVVLITLMGAVVDTAIAVTSALYEVHRHNPEFQGVRLMASGMSIGKDILSSTVNTLFFIFAGEYLVLFIYLFQIFSFEEMINSKEFAQQVVTISMSAAGCVLIIPTATAMAIILMKRSPEEKEVS